MSLYCFRRTVEMSSVSVSSTELNTWTWYTLLCSNRELHWQYSTVLLNIICCASPIVSIMFTNINTNYNFNAANIRVNWVKRPDSHRYYCPSIISCRELSSWFHNSMQCHIDNEVVLVKYHTSIITPMLNDDLRCNYVLCLSTIRWLWGTIILQDDYNDFQRNKPILDNGANDYS